MCFCQLWHPPTFLSHTLIDTLTIFLNIALPENHPHHRDIHFPGMMSTKGKKIEMHTLTKYPVGIIKKNLVHVSSVYSNAFCFEYLPYILYTGLPQTKGVEHKLYHHHTLDKFLLILKEHQLLLHNRKKKRKHWPPQDSTFHADDLK